MTLPDERFLALKAGKKLIEELCDPGKTPRVPGTIRDRARSVLHHYPNDWEFGKISDQCPELLNKVRWTVERQLKQQENNNAPV